MSDAVGLNSSTTTWETPSMKSLDEAVWQGWKAKGHAQDRRGRGTRIKALKLVSIIALLAIAALWSQLVSHEIMIRCVLVAVGGGMMFEALSKRQYGCRDLKAAHID